MTSFQFQAHTDSESFAQLADEWQNLLDLRNGEKIFSQSAILHSWWEVYHPGELLIVTIREYNRLIGLAPFYLSTEGDRRILKLVGGDEVLDTLDLILREGWEEKTATALLSWVASAQFPDWDEIHLQNIPAATWTAHALPGLMTERGWVVARETITVCPQIDLPDSYEAYLDQLDKKQRHELRRKRRKGEAAGVAYRPFMGRGADLSEAVELFFTLMAASSEEKATFIADPQNQAFFHLFARDLDEKGQMRLAFLYLDDRPLAAMWQLISEGAVLLYNSGYDPEAAPGLSSGNILFSYCVEESIAAGKKTYNFLRGDETYKLRLGGIPEPLYHLVLKKPQRDSNA